MSKRYYPFIDGLRAFSIFGVLLAHIHLFFNTTMLSGPLFDFINMLGPLGHLGVDMFFVISGFLITGILINDMNTYVDIKRFYTRRFFKIYPQYFLLVIIGIILFQILDKLGLTLFESNWYEKVSYLFFLQNYMSPLTTIEHAWSLAIEEHFYLFYPIIISLVFFVTRNLEKRRLILVWIIITLILIAIFNRHVGDKLDPLSVLFKVSKFHQTTLYRIDALLFGCLLKLCEPYYVNVKEGMKRIFANGAFIGSALMFSILLGAVNENGIIVCWDKYLFAYLGAGLLFMAGYFEYKPLQLLIEFKPVIKIGKISYALYLWHYPIIIVFYFIIPKLGVYVSLVLYVFVSLLISYLSTKYVENYFLNMRAKVAP